MSEGWQSCAMVPLDARYFNLQANRTKLFIVASPTKGGWLVVTPLRFIVRFKILYRVIKRLIQHCLLRKMVYLTIIIYVIATRNYEFLYYRHCSVINELLRYSIVTTYVLAK